MDEMDETELRRCAARAFGAAAGGARYHEQQCKEIGYSPLAEAMKVIEQMKPEDRIDAARAHCKKLMANSSGVVSPGALKAAREGAELGEAVCDIFYPPAPRPATNENRPRR
jgi:hypothetical protein